MILDEKVQKETEEKYRTEARANFDAFIDDVQTNLVGKEHTGECSDFKKCIAHQLLSDVTDLNANMIYACENHGVNPFDAMDKLLDFWREHNRLGRQATLEAQAKTAALNNQAH